MKNKILILFAHPRLERSQNNIVLVKHIPKIPEITFHDLYERYPDFNIDLEYEKKLLEEHNIIVWQHPFYWYSSPPLLKQWIDIVLEFGWAYGPGGNALQGKIVFNALTTGGPQNAYSPDGHNRFTLTELLAPFDQTAWLCKMIWLKPFVLFGTHRISGEGLRAGAENYRDLLFRLAEGDFSAEELKKYHYLNDWISETTITTDKK
jgi:glutathione-regulated potassium-efflux system ancillary protein KefG